MEANLLDKMLSSYMSGGAVVAMTLQNKIRVTGRIKAFDSYVVILEDSKQEIVFRHAVSSVSQYVRPEQKQMHAQKPAQAQSAPRPAKYPQQKATRPSRQAPKAAAAAQGEQSINSSMKDGLMRWMRENKTAK